MKTPRINFDTFTDIANFLDELRFFKINGIPYPEDVLHDIDDLRALLDDLPFRPSSSTKPADLFIESLAQLNDTGDIDVLVRHLSWQQQDISFLVSQLVSYERNLTKLDQSLQQIVKLKNDVKKLRASNAHLRKFISNLKSSNHEKKM